MRHIRLWLAAFVLAAQGPVLAQAAHPIRLIVGSGSGGALDVRARWLAERLGPALGETIVVENRPGAGGNISAVTVAQAPADGRTLLFVHQGLMAINPHLYAHPGFDALKDLQPVARVGVGPLLLVTGAQVPARSLPELLKLADTTPGGLSYATAALGSPPFMAVELLKQRANFDALHVPLGASALVPQIIGGHAVFTMESVAVVLPHVQSGRLRALAISGPRRLAALPDVPTVAEAGVPGYEFEGWMGVAAVAGTPSEWVQRVNREVNGILTSPEGREWFAAQGGEPGDMAVDAFTTFVRAEHARLGAEVRRLGLRVEGP